MSEAILGQGNYETTRIPLKTPGWGLLASEPDVRARRVFSLDPDSIKDFLCPVMRVDGFGDGQRELLISCR